MSLIEDLQRELQDVTAAVARAERTATAYPDMPSVMAQLRSIRSMQDNLRADFAAAADALGLDICQYHIEPNQGRRVTINAFTSTLANFQKVFTTVYDAVVNGPKKRARLSSEVVDLTALDFGYTFSGSLGVAMTLTNDRLLLGETKFDEAMESTFRLLSANSEIDIQRMTETVGLPAVRSAHQWADDNSKAGFGTSIVWQRLEENKLEFHRQSQEITDLAYLLGNAITQEEIVVEGDLVNVDAQARTFQMLVDKRTIIGTFSSAITEAQPARIPHRYRATLTLRTGVALVDGQEVVTYQLVRLEPAGARPPPSSALLPP